MKKEGVTNYTKTRIFTGILCLIVIIAALTVQLTGQNFAKGGCSYLDPITIDLLAFFVAIFLVVEGVCRISEHKNMGIKRQFTRSVRIAIGCAIITIHVLQFFHK